MIFNPLSLLRNGYIFFLTCLLLPIIANADSYIFEDTPAINSNGSSSSTFFQFRIDGLASSSRITNADESILSLTIKPGDEDIGKIVDIYNAVLVDGSEWWVLNNAGEYELWNISLKSLKPFFEGVTLEEITTVEIIRGKFNVLGELRYFFAYLVDNTNDLVTTPKAARVNIEVGEQLDASNGVFTLYKENIEEQIVQSKCIVCHIDGGLARNSSLQFAHRNELAAENNFDTLKNFLDSQEGGIDYILDTASGGNNHPGGVQLSKNSDQYKVFENVLRSIANGAIGSIITFGTPEVVRKSELSLFDGAVHESKTRTLRRAAIILAGRLPTDEEIRLVNDSEDYDFDQVLLSLMQGEGFHEFLFEGVEDRLLIRGGMCGVNLAHPNFVKLRELVWEYESSTGMSAQRIGSLSYFSCQRTAGELVAYIVENDLPYTEILTADYMMMNKPLNDYLGGTATFSDEDYWSFKPSIITEYYTGNNIDQSDEAIFTFHNRLNGYSNPLRPYPHAGLLTDLGFLARYPTTATNRNRARARWTFYHFLNIDIEKSSQRPTDAQALADTNNPTMNNANCTVCHSTLDPIAGAFQNWNEFDLYRSQNGLDSLDQFYKYPEDGSNSLYQKGDTWYRDMREPGLFEFKIKNNDSTLQDLADLIVAEDAFYDAAVKFWWPAIFGHEMLDKPVIETDTDYDNRLIAYSLQQASLEEFSSILKSSKNLKQMLVRMIRSPWSTVTALDESLSLIGLSEASITEYQLLNPLQYVNKTKSLTGFVSGRTLEDVEDVNYTPYQSGGELTGTYNLIYGGHDSRNVTDRSDNLTALTLDVVLKQAADLACPVTAIDFHRDADKRLAFKGIDITVIPNSSDPFGLTSIESRQIRQYIVDLVDRFHGNLFSIDDDEIVRIFNIFVEAYLTTKEENLNNLSREQFCWVGIDHNFPELLGLDPYGYATRDDNGFLRLDWQKYEAEISDVYIDDTFTKRAWQFVLIYLMTHYNYIHE